MYFDQDEQELVIPLKGWSAVLVIVLLMGWWIFSGYYTTRKANADRPAAAKSIQIYLQSNGVMQALPDGADSFDVENTASVQAMMDVARLQVKVLAVRGGLIGRKVVKAEVIEKGISRIVYYKIDYSNFSKNWDSMSIYETNEAVFKYCIWRGGG